MPPAIICDNSKEMILGEFNWKLKEAWCHLRQKVSFTPWLNAAEWEIKEMKKCSGRKRIKSRAPKRLWNDWLELESYIRSNTAHGIFKPDREVSKTVPICEFEWFGCLMFWDEMEPYLDDCFKLGMYLGPKIDDGLAMNTKILKKTGQVIHRSMFWALTQDE